jgi:hypothetical protein
MTSEIYPENWPASRAKVTPFAGVPKTALGWPLKAPQAPFSRMKK